MRLDLPSFALGFGAGATSATVARGVRPLILALGTAIARGVDSFAANIATLQEDVDDLVAASSSQRAFGRVARRCASQTTSAPPAASIAPADGSGTFICRIISLSSCSRMWQWYGYFPV